MAKRGRKPQRAYVTMWKEVVEGVRQVVIERDGKGHPTVWRLFPTGLGKPYFGTVRTGDLVSERKTIGKFLRWKAEQDGTPWEQHVGEEATVDAIWHGMLHTPNQSVADRRVERLVLAYAAKYRDFIRTLILTDPRKAAAELDIEQLAWLTQVQPPEASMPLTEVGSLYFHRRRGLSDHWNRKMQRLWDEFVRCVGVKTVREVMPADIEKYHDQGFDAFNSGKSPTYVAHRFGCVKTILSHALTRGRDQAQLQRVLTLCKMLVPPSKRAADPTPMSPKHFRALLNAVEREPKWKAIFLLALNAALYPSEVAAAKKADVDLAAGTLVMDRGKTGVPRVAVLWARTVEAIREYGTDKPHHSAYVFVSQIGDRYNANHISRNFSRRRDAIGLPSSVQFADLRDGAFTAAFNADGVEEKHAKVLAGHKTGMADYYVKRNPRMVAAASEAIERYYFPESVQP